MAHEVETAALEREVRRFLFDNFPLGGDAGSLDPEASLLEAGIIDSNGVLELVDFLESGFAIRISDDELLPENLNSISNIVHFLDRKLVG